MDLNKYQNFTSTTAVYPKEQEDSFVIELLYLGNGLAGEAGEVSNLIKKFHRDGSSAEKENKLVAELGDVMWYLSEICNTLGITLEEVMEEIMHKLADRQARNVIKGSGDYR